MSSTCTMYVSLCVVCSAIFLLPVCQARTGFAKDQNEDAIVFPPIKLRNSFDSKIPTGHLRPLGWQSEPRGKVREETTTPTPRQFYDRFVTSGTPVVFRRVIDNAPAMKNWQKNKYLIDKYGKIPVDVVVKKQRLRIVEPQRMTMQKFVREFNYEDWYLSNYVPHEMMHELFLPSCLACGFSDWLMESELWMSSGGTSSLLHSHADHDLHCVLSGRKDFIFIESKYKQVFKVIEHQPFNEAGHSELDMDMINMFKYSQIAGVPWTWATLRAGDCIFVPAGYLHQVRSYGRSISSTNHFAPSVDIKFDDCDVSLPPTEQQNNDSQIRLSDVNFLWSYIDGQLMLNNSELDAATMRHYLIKVLRNSTLLTFDIFKSFYDDVMAAAAGEFPQVKTAWNKLLEDAGSSRELDGLSRQQLKSMDNAQLEELADIFNIPWKQMRARKMTTRHTEL